tara:strand:- start:956 stop:1759 length:804 start_codon:yes stop_codon:yes gene_type:complete
MDKKKIIIIISIVILSLLFLFLNQKNLFKLKNKEKKLILELNNNLESNNRVENFSNINKKEDFIVERLHSNPDIFLIKNFLSKEECDHIINIGEPHIVKSEVCGRGGSVPHKSRTSMTAHIGKKFLNNSNPDKILQGVLKKASIFGELPYENIEPIQLVRYFPGQYFNKHYDYLDRKNPLYKNNIEKNGQREQTFFVYLNDVPDELGGKTHFHKINKTFQGKKGEAIFWRNVVDGKEDVNTLHSGTELKNGIKYGLNIWVREKKYIG